MMYYVVFSRFGVIGYTNDFSKVEALFNSTHASFMEYRYELRRNKPNFLDRL